MADKSASTPTPSTGTYVIDRPVYNSPGCLPLMPGDTRVFEHRLVAHLVNAGFMHADGTDANPLSVAVNSPTVIKSAPEIAAPVMPAAPAAIGKDGQPSPAPTAALSAG